jgi:ferredoxin--NADP+ reductase
MSPLTEYDLIVISSRPAGLSLAMEADRAGLDSVLVLTSTDDVVPASSSRIRQVPTHPVPGIESIISGPGGVVSVVAGGEQHTSGVVVVDTTGYAAEGAVPWSVPRSLEDRVHPVLGFEAEDRDVLVVGGGEAAVVAMWQLIADSARVVLCFTGRLDGLSRLSRQLMEEIEREQKATILWNTTPDEIIDLEGFPMAVFADRRTPDLQFDHVLIADDALQMPPDVADVAGGEGLYLIVAAPTSRPGPTVRPATAWSEIREIRFPHLVDLTSGRPAVDHPRVRELARDHYNATITAFDTAHNELWRIRVKPDHTGIAHRAGQYCSLGLGFWEPRADDAADPGLERKREKMVRRSYSISSPIFDDHGYLVDHAEMDDIELYIVWVQPSNGNVPALTPRLALKHVGDRIYLGPKVAGRYSLAPVVDPSAPVLFCATGTGEAPHNAMIVELLRKGHHGPILSAVSVRYRSDLAYVDEHERLLRRYPNYRYLTWPTRESDTPKRYMQDLLTEGVIEDALGDRLDPGRAHVFLCGNPSMIGLPDWKADTPRFPESIGTAELLHRRGFTIDRRGRVGNVHYEEYW